MGSEVSELGYSRSKELEKQMGVSLIKMISIGSVLKAVNASIPGFQGYHSGEAASHRLRVYCWLLELIGLTCVLLGQ